MPIVLIWDLGKTYQWNFSNEIQVKKKQKMRIRIKVFPTKTTFINVISYQLGNISLYICW